MQVGGGGAVEVHCAGGGGAVEVHCAGGGSVSARPPAGARAQRAGGRACRRQARARPLAGARALCDSNIKLLLSGSAEGVLV